MTTGSTEYTIITAFYGCRGQATVDDGRSGIIVTGSARLEINQSSGDSLAECYYLHRLLPFSPAELTQLKQSIDLNRLLDQGNFPEPYLATDIIESRQWQANGIQVVRGNDFLSDLAL